MIATLNTLNPETDQVQVIATRILCSTMIVYSAWRRVASMGQAGHSITTGRDSTGKVVLFERLGTERLPLHLDMLPRGPERASRVRAHQACLRDDAIKAIEAALGLLPAGARVDRTMGEVTVHEGR